MMAKSQGQSVFSDWLHNQDPASQSLEGTGFEKSTMRLSDEGLQYREEEAGFDRKDPREI
jgi:hypothetical protein